MRVITLVENSSLREDMGSEHGLSFLIETGRLKILFDMGQSALFAENAKRLDVDLADVDLAILSHGHYDHGGGLQRFLATNSKAPVYINPNAFGAYYSGTKKYIGLDSLLQDCDRLVYVDEDREIAEGLRILPGSLCPQPYDMGSFGLNVLENGQLLPDSFLHEQYLLIEEEGKTVLFSGCSHRGILNIAEWIKPDVLVGGFHFSKLPLDDTLEEYARILDGYETDFYTCHCTGAEQYDFLGQYMGRLHKLSAGQILIL